MNQAIYLRFNDKKLTELISQPVKNKIKHHATLLLKKPQQDVIFLKIAKRKGIKKIKYSQLSTESAWQTQPPLTDTISFYCVPPISIQVPD
ncbi:hypothetical protein IBT47_07665 [Erwinia sp. S43]|uniref:hypothetical protein n=1 Tax=Erwinia sp. S43 TaxID=2769339 RepID=UPI00190D33AA|nr:hypothetical protein [Erwinia sp. S43]MBK0032156.1 hypothetical protein [Erwinia sp. S43]